MILCFSKSTHLLPSIIQALLERIERTSASLRSLRRHGNDLDIQLLESSYFLFSMMEDILVGLQTSASASSSSTESSLRKARAPSTSGPFRNRTKQLPSCRGVRTDVNSTGQSPDVRTELGPRKGPSETTQCEPRVLALDQGFRTNVQQRLEDSLLHISHEFPLYAQYVWRLTGILDLMNVN